MACPCIINWHNDGQNFWDTHGNNFNRLKNDLIPPADKALSALLSDLEERGLLDETIVAWVGEFGRKPQIASGSAGRDHWPRATVACWPAVVSTAARYTEPATFTRRIQPICQPRPKTMQPQSIMPWGSTRRRNWPIGLVVRCQYARGEPFCPFSHKHINTRNCLTTACAAV